MEFAAGPGAGATLPASYFAVGSSSFTDLLSATNPELLPGRRAAMEAEAGASGVQVPHGTTIVATTFADGVLIAGDRRATMGNLIAQRDMEKVFVVDDHSAVGIAGSAGLAIEMVRLFAVELQHYEKLEGVPLSLDGKVNQLARMVRGNLGAAMQGFAVVPLFVGYDVDATDPGRAGRIVSFDVAGGHYDENFGYHAAGSGSLFARSSLKKLHDPTHDRAAAVRVAMEALYDAADDDSATGGPDTVRRIYPVVVTITADGAQRVADDEASTIAEAVVAGRRERPGGPAGS